MHLLAVVTAGPTQSPADSAVIQGTVIVVTGVILGTLGWLAKRGTARLEEIKNSALQVADKVGKIEGVLITPEPTPLVPHPPKGLVDIVADHTKSLGTLLSGTAELVADKASNGGTSSRDAIDRTEKVVTQLQRETVRVAENIAHDEMAHDDVDPS